MEIIMNHLMTNLVDVSFAEPSDVLEEIISMDNSMLEELSDPQKAQLALIVERYEAYTVEHEEDEDKVFEVSEPETNFIYGIYLLYC